jgi:hypothetical protein
MAAEDFREVLRQELAPLKTDIDTIKIQISGIPLLAATLHEIRESMRGMNQDIEDIRARLTLLESKKPPQ